MNSKKKKKAGAGDPRRKLPSVSAILETERIKNLISDHSRNVVLDAVRTVLAEFGKNLDQAGKAPGMDEVINQSEALMLQESCDALRPVVNAMGIVLHTGLGRAPFAKEASEALSKLHLCCNMQVNMEDGERGKRNYMTEQLICKLTGAEAAMVVNNNAAATFLILTTMCKGMEVVVSRGQLIEIGGSFRLPDCMRQSGAIMKEVGTTNKTHLRDYEAAINENTGALMRVYPSNFRVIGFTKSVSISEMASLKQKHPFIVIDDLGCGALINLEKLGLPLEPTVPGSLKEGADLVCSSGDKLIGGPQAGLIMGRKDLISRIKKHPMTRMLRVCKMTDLALETTLRLFQDPEHLLERHPLFRMMTKPLPQMKRSAARLKSKLDKENLDLKLRVAEDNSAVGGGSMPDNPLPTFALAVSSSKMSADRLNELLRQHEPPVMARISKNEVVLDMRTLLEGEDKIVFNAIKKAATTI